MSTAKQDGWHHTSPLAALFYLGKIYQAIAKNAVQSLAPLVGLLFAYQGDLKTKLIFGASVFFAVTVIGAILRYLFFRYQITDDSILIREGVLKKTQIDIKFDRIQAINTQQSVIYRAFGLVTVMLDTAGSKKQEGNIPAVKAALANDLKERIRQAAPARSAVGEASSNEDEQEERTSNARPLLLLRAVDMVKIGLSSNRALIFLVFLGPLFQQMGARVEDDIGESIEEGIKSGKLVTAMEGTQVTIADGLGLGLLIVVGVLLFLILASITGAFLRYHGFSLVTDNNVLRSTGGLLTRHEHSINLAKVQTVVTKQNVMLRLFRQFSLQARQASSGRGSRGKNFIIPLCEPGQLPGLRAELFGDENKGAILDPKDPGFLPIETQYFRSRFVLTGVLPAVALTTLMLVPMGLFALIFLLWIPLDAYIVWRLFKCYGVLVTADGFSLRRGFVGFRVTTFLHRKVQRVSVTQTLSQRRKGLATLRFYLASGTIKVPYVNFEKANELRDYVLYHIESSQLAWH